MKKLILIAAVSSLVLVACGGGGGGSSPTPTRYTPVVQKSGDTYIYSRTDTYSNGVVQTSPATTQVGLISSTGDHFVTGFDANNISLKAVLLNFNNQLVADSGGCSYSPALDTIPTPFYVGQHFSQTATATCNVAGSPAKQIVLIQVSSDILSNETISVPAGTFNTLRVQIQKTYLNGVIQPGIGIKPYTQNGTCWIDVVTGADVKCNQIYTQLETNSSVVLSSSTSQLTNIRNSALNPFVLTGSDFGVVIPYLYVTPANTYVLGYSGNTGYTFNTTQPVVWSITIGGNTSVVSGSNIPFSYNGLTVTMSSTSTSLTATTNGATLTNPVNFTIQAALLSDSTKVAKVNITNYP